MNSKVLQKIVPSCKDNFLKILQGIDILKKSQKTGNNGDGYSVLDKIDIPFPYSGKNGEDFTIFPTIGNKR